jgi:hypothetical protein
LRAIRDDYANREIVPDTWIPVDTRETYAAKWIAMEPSQRGDWLREKGIRMFASKDESAILPLPTRIAETARDGDGHRYGIKASGDVTLVVYFGNALAA